MRNKIDIDFIPDEMRDDPLVTIRARERTAQVEKIISAVEKAAEEESPVLPCRADEKIEVVSQYDIVRIYTEKRKIVVETEENTYALDATLSAVEEMLSLERFVRISQSEIVNLLMIKSFNFSKSGTIGLSFKNGSTTWVARSKVKTIKEMLGKV